jgi:hypothetical protein
VYRVRVVGQPVLAYIGQTGRTLRERLRALVTYTLWDEMPWDDPHTAAPALWSYRMADGYEFAYSVAPSALSKMDRMGLESYLIWQYRLEAGVSTLCNFGRMRPGYRKSRNRSTGDRGGLIEGSQPWTLVSVSCPPLQPHGVPKDRNWMGLDWTAPTVLTGSTLAPVPRMPGVYKLLDAASLALLYVGETSNLLNRLNTHRQRYWHPYQPMYSYSVMPHLTDTRRRLEVEDDLLGAYFGSSHMSPPFQYGEAGGRADG